jgi:hypothetical protein
MMRDQDDRGRTRFPTHCKTLDEGEEVLARNRVQALRKARPESVAAVWRSGLARSALAGVRPGSGLPTGARRPELPQCSQGLG